MKLAQTASAATALPEIWSKELAKLQDRMPADPPHIVEQILAEELGRDWSTRVSLAPGPPLGSATIAQVHLPTLARTPIAYSDHDPLVNPTPARTPQP